MHTTALDASSPETTLPSHDDSGSAGEPSQENAPSESSLPTTFDAHGWAFAVLAVAASILLLRYMQEVLIPFVLSGLIFYALDPVVDWLQRKKIPRALAAGAVLLSLAGGIGFSAYNLSDEALAVVEELPIAARKARDALRDRSKSSNSPIEKVQQAATEIDKATSEVAVSAPAPRGVMKVQIEEPGLRATDFIRWGSVGMFTLAAQGVMIFFLTYFLLLANDLFKRKLVKNFGATLSRKKITVQILDQISCQITRFLVIQIITSAIVAVVTAVALWLLGLDQPIIWGMAAGILNSIPYFGPVIVTAGLSTVAFLQFGTLQMAATVSGVALLITTLEGWLLTPILLGRAAEMNHVAVFAALLFWSWLWGVWGMLLAVPMVMVAKAICDHIEPLQPIADFLRE